MQDSAAQPAHLYAPTEPPHDPPNPLDDHPLSPPRPAPDEPLDLQHPPSSSAGQPEELRQTPSDPCPSAPSLHEPQLSPRPSMLAPPRQPPLAAASQRDAATTVELQAPSPYGDGELSSELSEPPESEASDEDGAASDWKDEENSGAAGLDAGPARRVDPVWYSEIADTFLRALNLVPNLGGTRVRLNGGLFRRTELLIEYVRRQTGQIRSPQQAQNRIDIQRWRNKDDASYQDLLSGRSATAQELAATDWDTLLGPDLFPHVKAPPSTRHVKKRRIFKVDRPPKKKPRRARPDSPESEQPRRSRRRRTTTSSSERSRSTTPDDMIDTAPPPRPASTRPRPPPPTPVPPLAVPLPQAAQLRTTDQAPQLFLHDLTAFFSSLHPTHNHEPSARALLELGVDSTSALVLLLGLEQSSLELLYQHLRRTGRLGPLDVAWLKKAVGAARVEFDRRK